MTAATPLRTGRRWLGRLGRSALGAVHLHGQAYDPRLDGIRAIAILLVMLVHSRAPYSGFGRLGVDIFFVLSGCLITRSLLQAPDLRRFFVLRFARLLPALLLLLLAYVFITDDVLGVLPVLLYVSNVTAMAWGEPHMLLHTWSLAVEEHYYLLWPFLLPWLLRQQNRLRLLMLLWVAFTLWRVMNHEVFDFRVAYYRTDTRLSGLILGSAVALGLHVSQRLMWLLVPALLIGVFRNVWMMGVAMPLVEIATAAAICSPPAWLARLSRLGLISYGVYLWHYFIFALMKSEPWYWKLAIGGGLTMLVAVASYTWIEAPVRRRVRAWVERRFNQQEVQAGEREHEAGSMTSRSSN
ncbi:acyltransferase family protein [Oxalicibacterium flavum]|uniref:acyltransferase family protein n=1 Tax=Oxalicibacterium flavum TaxID=179467 RepID=UPI00166F4397|nr:acyltransferase [Oxalicibacterium flavum]